MAESSLPTPLVSTGWLADQLGRTRLVVVDASWYLPALNRSAVRDTRPVTFPGAIFWDLDELSDDPRLRFPTCYRSRSRLAAVPSARSGSAMTTGWWCTTDPG